MIHIHKLEFWADSFHEGDWACRGMAKFLKTIDLKFIDNFIPQYTFELDRDNYLEITVLGSYKNWKSLPQVIDSLLLWGKPDLIVYDPLSQSIILAAEETAAVPTGNQALQRCERIYGSSRSRIPFWYLLSEYGTHIDGGIRRASIWPTILSLKLSCIHGVPSMVLHYSDKSQPEDYTAGKGYKELFKIIIACVMSWAKLSSREMLVPILSEQYRDMLDFVSDQQNNITKFIPGIYELNKDTPSNIAKYVIADENGDASELGLINYLNWGATNELPADIYSGITPSGTIKYDPFTEALEELVRQKLAYAPYKGSGSRPQSANSINTWVSRQRYLFNQYNKVKAASFNINLGDFPESSGGNLHITTAKNICYLLDTWRDAKTALISSYSRILGLLDGYDDLSKVLIYISNSLKPGRIFGDPYTGQLTAFCNIFAKSLTGAKTRITVAYYPHQVHTQLFNEKGVPRSNKGIIVMRELLDIAIFHGGIAVDLKTMEVK